MLLGSEHKERYDEMEADVNFRSTDFWFMRSPDAPEDEELNHVVGYLLQEFIHVGPFGSAFVKDHQNQWKSSFYGIPLQRHYPHPSIDGFEAMAFVANNPAACVLMKGILDYMRNAHNRSAFKKLGMSVMAVQRARSAAGAEIVVGMDMLTELEPLSIYEHPVNGRLLMAMQGEEVPEMCALTMLGKRGYTGGGSIHDLYMEATSVYTEYEMNEISDRELIVELFKLYKG